MLDIVSFQSFTTQSFLLKMIMTLRDWQSLPKCLNELIVQASSIETADGWQPWPIGMSWHFLKSPQLPLRMDKTNLLMCSFRPQTDQGRRPYDHNR
jgi:hypothetical protein